MRAQGGRCPPLEGISMDEPWYNRRPWLIEVLMIAAGLALI